MDDPEYEIHPLDRDYSAPVSSPGDSTIPFDVKLRRVGFGVFGAGFGLVLVVAIVLGSFRGSGTIESVGSAVHRLAMVMILIGGVAVVIAYRLPHLQAARFRAPDGLRGFPWNVATSYPTLVFWNILLLIAVPIAAQMLRPISTPRTHFLVVNAVLTITPALLATIGIWHRGLIRAYAIGVLVALLLNHFSNVLSLVSGYGRGQRSFLFYNLCIVLISGLLCAGYVGWLESANSKKLDRIDGEQT
jgi:hypothetical protein